MHDDGEQDPCPLIKKNADNASVTCMKGMRDVCSEQVQRLGRQ